MERLYANVENQTEMLEKIVKLLSGREDFPPVIEDVGNQPSHSSIDVKL